MHAIRYRRLFINLSMAPFLHNYTNIRTKIFSSATKYRCPPRYTKKENMTYSTLSGPYVLDKFHILILIQL